jgi:hypothetical protein
VEIERKLPENSTSGTRMDSPLTSTNTTYGTWMSDEIKFFCYLRLKLLGQKSKRHFGPEEQHI